MYIQDFEKIMTKAIENNTGKEELLKMTKLIADGDVHYAFPYQMKEFMILYAKYTLIIFS
jgi:hypothetical protein